VSVCPPGQDVLDLGDLLLFGMMVIVSVLRQTGLFGALAVWSVQASDGRPSD